MILIKNYFRNKMRATLMCHLVGVLVQHKLECELCLSDSQ